MKRKPTKEDLEKLFESIPEDERPEIFDGEAMWDKALADSEAMLEELAGDESEEESKDSFEKKYNEAQDRYRRILAEFDNYRKRTAKEMASRYNDGIRATCEKLLPIIDNFDRAIGSVENKDDKFFQGVELIARQFEGVLAGFGIETIPVEPGTPFDPNIHNAVAHVEDKDFGVNVVIEVLQNGYKHGEKVLRHVMVKVAN